MQLTNIISLGSLSTSHPLLPRINGGNNARRIGSARFLFLVLQTVKGHVCIDAKRGVVIWPV